MCSEDQNIINRDFFLAFSFFNAISFSRIAKEISKGRMRSSRFPAMNMHRLHQTTSMRTLWTVVPLVTHSHINLRDRTTIYLNPKTSL